MIADSAILVSNASRPRSFAALMTLYESNYVRLGWLLEDLDAMRETSGQFVSRIAGDPPLFLAVEEVCRYTTTVHMTYYFDDVSPRVADPDLRVRVYHDARLAEAMACGRQRRHPALAQFDTSCGVELRRRWTRNVMLNKWLEYCVETGHRFDLRAAPCDEPILAL